MSSDLPWPCCRKLPVLLPCWPLCPARLQEQRPGVHGQKRRSASRGDWGAPGWWHSGWRRPPPHSGLQTRSRCLKDRANYLDLKITKTLKSSSFLELVFNWKNWPLTLTRYSRGDSAPQSGHCGHGDLLRGELLSAGVSSSHHVGLQQSALQVHMVVRQSLVHSSQNLKMNGQIHYCICFSTS